VRYRRRVRLEVLVGALLLWTAVALLIVSISGTSANHRSTSSRDGIPEFRRVVLIVLENKSFDEVIGNRNAPELNTLARRYALLTRYLAVAHPSLPNYLALVSGSTQGVTNNCTECRFAARNLSDTLAAAHRTWKTYSEGLPAPGFVGATRGLYAKKHNPFLYFQSVLSQPVRQDSILPLSHFDSDLFSGNLPDFSLVVPDLCNSAHNCPLNEGDEWLGGFLKPILGSRQLADSVIFVTFDEGYVGDTAGGGGHVPTLVLGPLVRRGVRASARLSHYSLLRTIEDAWGLPALGESASAEPIRSIWR
jgi:phosphatidylinositol-3-phosphatase